MNRISHSRLFRSELFRRLSAVGLVFGLMLFAISLTPSLIPRPYVVQGLVSGLSLFSGYMAGIALVHVWTYLELPEPRHQLAKRVSIFCIIAAAGASAACLWQASEWQNSVRVLMQLEPVSSSRPMEVGAISALVFLLLLCVARLFRMTQMALRAPIRRFLPARVSLVVSVVTAVLIFWSVSNGLIFRSALDLADNTFKALDQLMPVDLAPPTRPGQTGSVESLLVWKDIGQAGRSYVSKGPNAADIAAITNRPAKDPIRIYVGLRSADTARQRARLALKELIRSGGFDRSVLVVATPTGTGWMDPAAVDGLEFLHHGDVATVAQQYSYLASWLSLLVEPEYGSEAARALFDAIYGHWVTLPADRRPRLYVFGLSLGAFNSERSFNLIEQLGNPVDGAFWAGPPFVSPIWNSVTRNRNKASPAWLPTYGDGATIRFTNQSNALRNSDDASDWGVLRVVYLQYASDPIVFFQPGSFLHEPDWMKAPRGPDVSPHFSWFPFVTGLQLLVDITIATTTPTGFGHVYAPENYVEGWRAVTRPPGWTDTKIEALKRSLRERFEEAE